MQKQLLLFTAILLSAAIGLVSCNFTSQITSLNAVQPAQAGLDWQECLVTEGTSNEDFNWKQAGTCFGHSMPLWNNEEKVNFGTRFGPDGYRLAIGADVYEAMLNDDLFPKEKYTLYKNGNAIQDLSGKFLTFSPNQTLQNIGGKAAWEFSDGDTATVIYDGTDVRNLYNLDRAYRPYGLNGKLIFIGKRDGQYFVVYDQHKVGPEFEKIVIAYCCEPVLWSVQYGQGRYLFWGRRNGQWYITEITALQK